MRRQIVLITQRFLEQRNLESLRDQTGSVTIPGAAQQNQMCDGNNRSKTRKIKPPVSKTNVNEGDTVTFKLVTENVETDTVKENGKTPMAKFNAMKSFLIYTLLILLSFHAPQIYAKNNSPKPLQCVAFSPYINQLTPNYGAKPNAEIIETLLDALIKQTPFRCIMSYGVLNGLETIFPAAKKRGIKVIAILWIDKDKLVNTDSIAHGIALAREYPETIVRLSCGSEVRTRHNYEFDSETERCLNALREAKVTQPIGVIDTWWEWCNRTQPCHQNQFSAQVDWIGINVFPWWENRHSGLFSCVNANEAADFHLARWQEVKKTNPTKEVIITEFGWVSAPEGKAQISLKTKQECGIASRKNQQLVVQSTFKKLTEKKVSAVAFEAFSENWKANNEEGDFGRFWGLCDSTPPYTCHISLKP